MLSAMDGHEKKRFRGLAGLIFLIAAFTFALTSYRTTLVKDLAHDGAESLRTRHSKVLGAFQASYYFFYEDQFLPTIQQSLIESKPKLAQIQVYAQTGQVVFDSLNPKKPSEIPKGSAAVIARKEVIEALGHSEPSVFIQRFKVQILMPSGAYGVLYTFDGTLIRNRILITVAPLFILLFLGWRFRSHRLAGRFLARANHTWNQVWGLRGKFLAAIVLINVFTAAIVFWTVSALQIREQTHRIEKESFLFGQFSTSQLVSDFTNYFYFYYSDRFLPSVRRVIASNENLLGVKIVSARNKTVLFDSEIAPSGPSVTAGAELNRIEFSEAVAGELGLRDIASWNLERAGEKHLSVATTFRGDNGEPLFWLVYTFSFQSLSKSVQAIRRQILLDLIPSLLLSLIIATGFASLMISPIRKLVSALQSVTQGDFDVAIDIKNSDEIGELVSAFNTMTLELKKKKELRKYLSESTYRQIMEAPDSAEGVKLGGARVSATVLFSDIRNFVAHCENLEAEEVTSMLNEYFTEMVEVVHKHGGEVDKFIGDALLAVFYTSNEEREASSGDAGRRISGEVTAIEAIYCAMEMRERLTEFNRKRLSMNKNSIEIGVGITHGEIISGPIGARDRMDFTVIGDVVNTAS
ncbi:MAG: adenylate/guanylate cyclase domain-containing protein, partial [Bdellovibrionota bacterium]